MFSFSSFVLASLLVALVASSAPVSFLRVGKNDPNKARARLIAEAVKGSFAPRGPVGCKICVDFFDANLNQILNIILDSTIEQTCGGICSKLPKTVEQDICEAVCIYEGITGFLNALDSDDLDPIHICATLHQCKQNTCTGACTSIISASVSPSTSALRSKFRFTAKIQANNNTGVGVTVFSFPANTESGSEGAEVINDGLVKGTVSTFTYDLNTAEQDWIYAIGTNPVEVLSCGEDCTNAHGTVFTAGYTNFTITKN